jgi:hypothetical protein
VGSGLFRKGHPKSGIRSCGFYVTAADNFNQYMRLCIRAFESGREERWQAEQAALNALPAAEPAPEPTPPEGQRIRAGKCCLFWGRLWCLLTRRIACGWKENGQSESVDAKHRVIGFEDDPQYVIEVVIPTRQVHREIRARGSYPWHPQHVPVPSTA